MKHLLLLLMASLAMLSLPGAACAQDSPDVQSESDASSRRIGPIGPSVIGVPPTPFNEAFVNLGAVSTLSARSICQPCPPMAALQRRAFGPVAPLGAGTAESDVDTRFISEFGYARGFTRVRALVFLAEFPVVLSPNGNVNSGNLSVARSYSSLFFTPALRVMCAPDHTKHPGYPPIYPWFSLGGGLAHFSPSSTSLAGTPSGARSSTEGALQVGAGWDTGLYRKSVALRVEVRDFYTAPPNLGVPGINLRHNVVAAAGIVFRFCRDCWKDPTAKDKN